MDDKHDLEYHYRLLAIEIQATTCQKEKIVNQIKELKAKLGLVENKLEALKQDILITVSKLSKYD